MKTACKSTGSQRAFLESIPGGLREWHVHVSHRQFAIQQLLRQVWPPAFRFHLYSICVPLPWNFNIGCCANEKPLRSHTGAFDFSRFVSTLVLGEGRKLIEPIQASEL